MKRTGRRKRGKCTKRSTSWTFRLPTKDVWEWEYIQRRAGWNPTNNRRLMVEEEEKAKRRSLRSLLRGELRILVDRKVHDNVPRPTSSAMNRRWWDASRGSWRLRYVGSARTGTGCDHITRPSSAGGTHLTLSLSHPLRQHLLLICIRSNSRSARRTRSTPRDRPGRSSRYVSNGGG